MGEAKVAKAKQRILAGQYGLRTPKNNRVKEAILDLRLSGKQAQRLREELYAVPTPMPAEEDAGGAAQVRASTSVH